MAVALLPGFLTLFAQSGAKKDSLHVVLDEITVSSIRAGEKSAVTFTNVTAKQLEKVNMAQDIPYLLSQTPSFVATSDAGTGIGYTGYRVRGTDANRVNVTVNGVPLNDSESHGVFFVNMPDFASSLSSVQIQRGVGSSTNGAAAFGASINMVTEGLNPKPYAELASTYGSFNTNKNMVKVGSGMINNRWAFDARLSNITSDGYIDRAFVDMASYFFTGGYFGNQSVVRFVTFGGREKTYQAWNGVSRENLETNRTYNEIGFYKDAEGKPQFYDNQTDNYNQTHYQLHWLQRLKPGFNMNVTAHYTRGLGFYEDYKEKRKYHEYGLTAPIVNGVALSRTDLIRQKWLDNHFGGITWALNYDREQLKVSLGGAVNRYDGDHIGKIIWVRNASNLDIGKDWYRNNGQKDDANVYLKAGYELLPDLFLNGDIQYRYINYSMQGTDDKYDSDAGAMRDITQNHVFHFLNPKAGATYSINNNNDVYASFSVANREPNRNNYTESGVNERPVSERLYNTELGYRYRSADFSAGINFFDMKYKNQLILTGKISEIGELLTSNIPDSYRRGVEVMAGAKLTNWLRWDANVALSQHKILNFTEQDVDVYDADWNWTSSVSNDLGTTNIAMSPNVVFNNMFTFSFKGVECVLASSYVGKQYLDNTSNDDRSMPAYFFSNLTASYSLPLPKMKSVDFRFQLNNLFDSKYVTNGYVWYSYYLDGKRENDLRYFPQAGTHYLASVSLKF